MREKEENTVEWNELFSVLKKQRKKGFLVVLFFFFICLFFSLTTSVVYLANASFKDKALAKQGGDSSLFSLLSSYENNEESEAMAVMQSKFLIGQVIKEMGLQANLVEKKSWLKKTAQKVKDNFFSEYAFFFRLQDRLHSEFPESIDVDYVRYEKEVPSRYSLFFLSDDKYEVRKGKKKILEAKLNEIVSYQEELFRVIERGKEKRKGKTFELALFGEQKKISDLQKQLFIKNDKKRDKKLLLLSFSHPDRKQAAVFLNTLMKKYLVFLENKQNLQMEKQLSYLQIRKKETRDDLNILMEEYAKSLSTDIGSSGFTNTKEELGFFATWQQKYRDKMMMNEVEILKLEKAVKENSFTDTSSQSSQILPLLNEIRSLKKQREDLNFSLKKLDQTKPFVRFNEEKIFPPMTLETASALFFDYTKLSNQMESEEKKISSLLFSMEEEDFEIPSLSTLLHDPVVQESVAETKKLLFAYQDENNRSGKEQKRLQEEIKMQKQFLHEHLQQTKKLLQEQIYLLEEKTFFLQKLIRDLLQQQIFILETQLKENFVLKIETLNQENQILEEHLKVLQKDMTDLPAKWVKEQLMQEELTIRERVVEEISKTVEMKNIALHLELIQSAPLDFATPPLHPKPPQALLFSFLGIFLGLFAFVSFSLFETNKKGAPLTKKSLERKGFTCFGKFSNRVLFSLEEKDLSLLRRISTFLLDSPEKKSILLVQGKGPCYAESLAKLLYKRGKTSLLLDCSFEHGGEKISIEKESFGAKAKLPAIGKYDLERGSASFLQEKINHFSKDYDFVVGYSSFEPLEAETEALAGFFSSLILTLKEETYQDLHFYLSKKMEISFIFT